MVMQDIDRSKLLLWVDRSARWSISFIFIFAAVPKLLNVSQFAATIDAFSILSPALILPVAIILPVVEIVLAVGLLFNGWKSKVGSGVLLLMFIMLLSYSISVGLDIDCGCFGPEDPEYSAFHGLRTALMRDIVMLLPLIYSFWYHRYRQINFHIQGETQQ
ncbi:MAG: MauE/DoxX family redox-associated membrane protein [Pseudomonadota bacterium]